MNLHLSLDKRVTPTDTCYKKNFGKWGETTVDNWMELHKWTPYRKNLKMRHGEIDRIYSQTHSRNEKNFCIAEIKTIYCNNQKKFFSFFTESGLSALIKRHQITNLYKFAEHLSAQTQCHKVFVRFFIVLQMYKNYEKDIFFLSQAQYKICLQTQNELILSFLPEFK